MPLPVPPPPLSIASYLLKVSILSFSKRCCHYSSIKSPPLPGCSAVQPYPYVFDVPRVTTVLLLFVLCTSEGAHAQQSGTNINENIRTNI